MLNLASDEALYEEGLAREVTNRIQKLRKEAKLVPTVSAVVYAKALPAGSLLEGVINKFRTTIEQATSTPILLEPVPEGVSVLKSSTNEIKEDTLEVCCQS